MSIYKKKINMTDSANKKTKVVIITGPPYSGKGTQCKFLVNRLGYKHISTGELIRAEDENKTEMGLRMAVFADNGQLVPDDLMKALFDSAIVNNINEEGIILDGYPRTVPQVRDLIEVMSKRELKINQVLNIEVPKEELLVRAKKRAEDSDRIDDKDPQTHLRRLKVFEEETKPAIKLMKEEYEVLTFDGLGSIEKVRDLIKASF